MPLDVLVGIYTATRLDTGRVCYVGQAASPGGCEARWRAHEKADTKLGRIARKHGIRWRKVFEREFTLTGDEDVAYVKRMLGAWEIWLIRSYGTCYVSKPKGHHGCNGNLGGSGGQLGRPDIAAKSGRKQAELGLGCHAPGVAVKNIRTQNAARGYAVLNTPEDYAEHNGLPLAATDGWRETKRAYNRARAGTRNGEPALHVQHYWLQQHNIYDRQRKAIKGSRPKSTIGRPKGTIRDTSINSLAFCALRHDRSCTEKRRSLP